MRKKSRMLPFIVVVPVHEITEKAHNRIKIYQTLTRYNLLINFTFSVLKFRTGKTKNR